MLGPAQIALRALIERMPVAEIAARCNVSAWTVYDWSRGRQRPSSRAQAALAEHCHIHAREWTSERQALPFAFAVNGERIIG